MKCCSRFVHASDGSGTWVSGFGSCCGEMPFFGKMKKIPISKSIFRQVKNTQKSNFLFTTRDPSLIVCTHQSKFTPQKIRKCSVGTHQAENLPDGTFVEPKV